MLTEDEVFILIAALQAHMESCLKIVEKSKRSEKTKNRRREWLKEREVGIVGKLKHLLD